MDSYVYLSSHLPPAFREQVAEAVRTCRDMTEADPDDLEEAPGLVQVPSNTATVVVSSPIVPTPVAPQPIQQLNAQERLAHSLTKEFRGKADTEVLRRLGSDLGRQVLAVLQSQAPSLKQAFEKRQRAERAANAQFTKDLAAAGVPVRQHSENEYVRVIMKQLDLQLEGVNPSVNTLLAVKLKDRPQGRRLFDILRAGDMLVVRWVDRLGRNYTDVTESIRKLIQRGVIIKTVFDGSTTDPV